MNSATVQWQAITIIQVVENENHLVKTHPSGDGEIDLEKPCLISQLALVDLAGAERAIRTGNAGSALKEAGMITFSYNLESIN